MSFLDSVEVTASPHLDSPIADGPQILDLSRPTNPKTQVRASPEPNLMENNDNSRVNEMFCNPVKPPSNLNLPSDFNWVFLHGVWTLVLTKFSKDLSKGES